MSDARFEDGAPGGEDPLRLRAETAEDLEIISTLTQDAVAQVGEISFAAKRRRFMLLLNRFRWEDRARAEAEGRGYERVQSLLVIEGVMRALADGIDASDKDLVLNLLELRFEAGEDAAGRLVMTFAGDGALALEVEALDVSLKDVSRPYLARASSAPSHDDS